ncbi:hypothetical protein EHE19_001220 [Ruminiclostridium herbifermentans]|uniref:DUF6873 domain-containing protein n=1 Tax=Ruminiclostridium herbifermentans TaxID=2488810 RepID=A0A4U7JGT9_9FIRM|nr:hypothetical protein [Ruminiclostridium herbifermentans]QNU67204.1 hypothetical protein EHE19_001220 [Ruminiclostridium herbifermentans]
MKPIEIPNLPTNDVSVVIIDKRASNRIKETLKQQNILLVETLPHPDIYPAVAYHPDIMFHHIYSNMIVYAPNTPQQLIDELTALGFDMLEGQASLNNRYPHTIAYNIARVGKYAFHNTKYTDPLVKKLLIERGIKFIHVNQGYSKCLTCIIDENSIITSDKDIYKKAKAAKLDALLIEPDKSIQLEPYDMGFLGGATGLIGRNKLAFTGNIKLHKNYNEILNFLSLKNVDMVMLNDDRLMDLGTIIPIRQK